MKRNLSELLRKKGLKVTRPRLLVLDAFSDACSPMNAEFLSKKLKTQMNEVTIYRILAQFESKRILRRVELRKDSIHYELSGNHHHHHIVCTHCGSFEHFELCVIHTLSKKVLSKSLRFSSIHDHSLELFSVCNECAKK